MSYFLGLDSSTQSLSALVVDTKTGRVVLDESVNYGKDLPQYESPQGVLPNGDASVCHSDPLMWVEALDLLLSRVQASGFDWSKIRGISGAGQQHGSVYLARSLSDIPPWDTSKQLVEQVRPLLSFPTSPMWMDSSTGVECAEIAEALGSRKKVSELSGSEPIERFTGPQIRRLSKRHPQTYAATTEIHLVSSFIASLLIGKTAPIDLGDGAGMNLLELSTGDWNQALLDATAPGLREKLAPLSPSAEVVGTLSAYFSERYGFAKEVPVVAFTGDNPSSLVGMGAIKPGTRLVSLGTSDTVFAAMDAPRTDPNGFGHVFGNPAGGFMSLLCFTNGSLAREKVAEHYSLDWAQFASAILEETKPGNNGKCMLPYFVPETTPKLGAPAVKLFGDDEFVDWKQPAATVRAVVEAQALSIQRFSSWIGHEPEQLVLTGGASRNPGIRRVLADVFQAPVRVLKVANSSALGGALRAAQAVGNSSWSDLFSTFVALDPEVNVTPNPQSVSAYAQLREQYTEHLDAHLRGTLG